MVSPENPTGEKGKGAMAVPNPADPDLSFSNAAVDLGKGWKVRPFIKVKAHEMVIMMDVAGPGVIQHIWMATAPDWKGNGRASVLRLYWDGEETPSVETSMTDFFAVGHELFARVNYGSGYENSWEQEASRRTFARYSPRTSRKWGEQAANALLLTWCYQQVSATDNLAPLSAGLPLR